MNALRTILAAALFAAPAVALAQADAQPSPLKDLLNDGFDIVSTASNGNAAELVMILRKDKRHYACVLSQIRADSYAQGRARPVAQPCIPLN